MTGSVSELPHEPPGRTEAGSTGGVLHPARLKRLAVAKSDIAQ
jgi:hypothetical protein